MTSVICNLEYVDIWVNDLLRPAAFSNWICLFPEVSEEVIGLYFRRLGKFVCELLMVVHPYLCVTPGIKLCR
jgi:hypothetical protein